MAGWNANKYWIWMTHLVVFSMVLEIFNNESVNSIYKYKLKYKFKYKLGGFYTWELVPDITDYKLDFMTQKFENLDEIQHIEIFAVVKFWSGKIKEFLRQCHVIIFDSI